MRNIIADKDGEIHSMDEENAFYVVDSGQFKSWPDGTDHDFYEARSV